MINKLFKSGLIIFLSVALAGCTVIFQKGRRSDLQKIEDLSRQLDELNQAKGMLEERLSQEIGDNQVKLQMMEKGLVVTVVGDVLFDSGKAQIRQQAKPIVDKISGVLKESVPELEVGIEGHTDNEPIKQSGWKSNWELSSARALAVVHYLTDDCKVKPQRLSANGYGEYRPVAANDNEENMQKNRRVEIVILPSKARK